MTPEYLPPEDFVKRILEKFKRIEKIKKCLYDLAVIDHGEHCSMLFWQLQSPPEALQNQSVSLRFGHFFSCVSNTSK